MRSYRLLHTLGIGTLLAVLAVPAYAADSGNADKWEFEGQIYLWGASIDATPTGGDTLHISFSDLINNLNMAFMGGLGARKGKWSLMSDLIYLDADNSENGAIPPSGSSRPGIPTKVEYGLKSWIVTLAGGYKAVETVKYDLDLLAGARYIWIEAPLEFDLGPLKEKFKPSGNNWDAIVGARGKLALSDKWYMNYYADVGTGDSDLTWQALLGLGYKFEKVDAVFGYRYLDYDNDGPEMENITIKGPYGGVKFRF